MTNPDSDSIHIKDCSGAYIYLFDVSSDVEVTGCRDCEVYVMRVVDGPVLLEDCVGCKLVVASQQFQAKRCHDCWFGIYSVTGPTLSESSGIEISPWSGCGDRPLPGVDALGLSRSHPDRDPRLDPSANQFLNVYDASESCGDPSDPSQARSRNFVVRFDPVSVKVLGVRKRGDSSSEESLMAWSNVAEYKVEVEGSGTKTRFAPASKSAGGAEASNCSIKAIKMCEDATWQKTLDLIDMSNNSSKHLTRFKSVLLSMTTRPAELDRESDAVTDSTS